MLPRSDGRAVIAVLTATAWPFTYSVPVVPDSVTARCVQVPAVRDGPFSCCSPPELAVTIPNRRAPAPDWVVRNM